MVTSALYSCVVASLCLTLFSNTVTSAPMLTHVNGKTSIWVTSDNTLNSTVTSPPHSERELGQRSAEAQWGPPQHGEGPPQQGPPEQGPPQQRPPQQGPPQWGPPQYGPPDPDPTTWIVPSPPASTPSALSVPTEIPSPPASPPISTPSAPVATTPAPTTSAPPPPPATSVTTSAPTSSAATSPPPSGPSTSSSLASSTATTTATTSPPAASGPALPLKLSLVNTLSSNAVNAYLTALDSSGRLVMLTKEGTFYYPTASSTDPTPVDADVAIPLSGQGQSIDLAIPDYISSARLWFSDGTLSFSTVVTSSGIGLVEPTAANPNDPSADVNWGFMELTYTTEGVLYANLSFVDFVGLPVSMSLAAGGGTQTALGVGPDGVSQLCEKLQEQAKADGQPWDDLCVYNSDNQLIRVVSPSNLLASNAASFADYWSEYIDSVWSQYSSTPLMIDTQASAGQVSCTTSGDVMTCEGDDRTYTKPSAQDIFGCSSGPFTVLESDNAVHQAVVPRLCAAFHRATLHIQGGNVQPSLPPTQYYQATPNNYYSKLVHEIETDGKGYAFPYDDVTPSSQYDTAGVVTGGDVQLLTIFVGGSVSG